MVMIILYITLGTQHTAYSIQHTPIPPPPPFLGHGSSSFSLCGRGTWYLVRFATVAVTHPRPTYKKGCLVNV